MQAPADKDLAAQQEIAPGKMTVPQLKEQLRTFNMFTSGKKADLVHRLETALAAAATTGHASDAKGAADNATARASDHAEVSSAEGNAAVDAEAGSSGRDQNGAQSVAGVQPGTEMLGEMTTFQVWHAYILSWNSHWHFIFMWVCVYMTVSFGVINCPHRCHCKACFCSSNCVIALFAYSMQNNAAHYTFYIPVAYVTLR